MSAPVRRLTIYHPVLSSPVPIDLPESAWDLLPPGAQEVLDGLDADDSSDLVYNLDVSNGPLPDGLLAELTHANDSTALFRRLFWSFQGDHPNNNFVADNATYPDRLRISEQIQDTIFERVVGPLLSENLDDEDRWTAVNRLLVTLGDARHLHAIARLAMESWALGRDRRYLDRAESLLLEAKRGASGPRHLRGDWFDQIDITLRLLSKVLDKLDSQEFEKQRKLPTLMATMGAPLTVNVTAGVPDRTITIRVAVPKGFNPKDLVGYFTHQKQVVMTPSVFEGRTFGEAYPLSPLQVLSEREARETLGDNNSFVRDESLDAVLFDKDMDYYQIVFALPEPVVALGDRALRKFDLLVEGESGTDRRMPAAVVLQNLDNRDVRIVFAADTHVNERDLLTKKQMVDSLLKMAASKNSGSYRSEAERVERFYRSFNENVEVMVEEWNALYRSGEIHRVHILGDLADYINIAFESRILGFRETNIRRLIHILSKLEAPVSMKAGNHDFHIIPFSRSAHQQGFSEDEDLYNLYAEHADRHEFGTDNPVLLTLYALAGLLPRAGNTDGRRVLTHFFLEAAKEALADDAFFWQPDEGMHHHYRHIDHQEVTLTRMGNTYVADLQTWLEHFNADEWRFEELHPDENNSLFTSFWDGLDKYLLKQHANGKGYRADAFLYFVRMAYKVRDAGGNLVVTGHYPPFATGSSAIDGTPLAEDALKGNPNWSIRLLSFHLNHGLGRRGDDPVIDLVVSGHVHKWGEFDFDFSFNQPVYEVATDSGIDPALKDNLLRTIDPTDFLTLIDGRGIVGGLRDRLLAAYAQGQRQRDEFLKGLDELFGAVRQGRFDNAPGEFYEAVHGLRHEYHLDQRIMVRQVVKRPDEGFPGGLVRYFNSDSGHFGKKHGTLFLNLPASGPAPVPGYAILTVHPDGKKTVEGRSFYRKPDGTLLKADRYRPQEMSERQSFLIDSWKASHGDVIEEKKPGEAVPSNVVELLPPHPVKHFELVPFPVITQAGHVGLEATIGPGFNLSRGGNAGVRVGAQLTLPLSHRHYSFFGPNNAFLELAYDGERNQARTGLGLNLGLVTPLIRTAITDPTDLEFGLRIYGQSAALIPAPEIIYGRDGDVRVNLMWRYTLGAVHAYDWIPGLLSPYR